MGVREIGRNSLRGGYLAVMSDKVMSRIVERDPKARVKATEWARSHSVTFSPPEDDPLWHETREFEASFRDHARSVVAGIPYDLGGGGNWPLLRYLVRVLRPEVVVETGVAAGWSSAAILNALHANGRGQLWSSDFPYFRLPDPEQYVGVVVPGELKDRWHLLVKGDRVNLPEILASCGEIDLFHYDSDKSYRGRRSAIQAVEPRLSPDAVVIFDDIQDNMHFADYVERNAQRFAVVEFEGKFVGVTGPGAPPVIERLAAS